jgi:hypothetical protein
MVDVSKISVGDFGIEKPTFLRSRRFLPHHLLPWIENPPLSLYLPPPKSFQIFRTVSAQPTIWRTNADMWSINPMTPPRPTLNHMAPPDLVSVEESRRLAGRTSNICRLTRLKASSSHSNHPLPKPKNGKHSRVSEKATKTSLPLPYQPRLKKPALSTLRRRLLCLKIFPSLDHVHCRKLKGHLGPYVIEVSKGYRVASSAASHQRTLPFHDDLPHSSLQILIKSSSKHGKNPNSTSGAAFPTAMRMRLSLSSQA